MTITLIIIAAMIGLALIIIGFMRSGVVALLSGAALFILVLLVASVAYAHDAPMGWKYEAYCCNGDAHTGDCQQIRTDRVRITSNGYEVEIRPGDHRLATVHHQFRVPMADARRSQDEFYHLCLYPDEFTLRCFYAPDMAY